MSDSNDRTEHSDRILGCACDLYLRDGFEGFSMRKLAREVGVTAPAIYRHYEGKEALLVDVVKEAYKVMAQHLYGALGGASPEDRFRLAGDAYLDFAMEHPRYYEITYSYPQFLGIDEPHPEIAPLECGIGQFWNDRVRECMDSGFLLDDDTDAVALSFWAFARGLISIHQRGLLQVDDDAFREIYRAQIARLIAGVGGEHQRECIRRELEKAEAGQAPPKPSAADPRRADRTTQTTRARGDVP